MKIFIFCAILALGYALPLETNSNGNTNGQNDKVPAAPSAYVHRPLADQQGQTVPKSTSDDSKPKRDTSAADTKKYQIDDHSSIKSHDNAPSTFVRPVPVSQILGKVNTETHSAVKPADDTVKTAPVQDNKQSAPVDLKPKRDTTQAQNVPQQPAVSQKSQQNDDKSSEEKEAQRKTRDAPKTVAQTPAVNQKTQDKKPEDTTPLKVNNQPRTRRENPQSQVPNGQNKPTGSIQPPQTQSAVPYNPAKTQGSDLKGADVSRLVRDVNGPTPTPQAAKVDEKKPEDTPLKVSNQPRTRRENPQSQVPNGQNKPTGNIQPSQTQSAVPYNPAKTQGSDLKGADISRLVRDVSKVNGPTPVPQATKVDVKDPEDSSPVKVSNQPRTRRENPKSQVPIDQSKPTNANGSTTNTQATKVEVKNNKPTN